MQTLQQTCLRQSTEIDRLKELMTRLLVEAEQDRGKLRQRAKEIRDLTKCQQRLTQSTSLASGSDMASTLTSYPTVKCDIIGSSGQNGSSPLAVVSSTTAPSLSTFSLSGDSSPTGILDRDDLYETDLPYADSFGVGPAIHPLSSLPSRSNSGTSLQSQLSQQCLVGMNNQASNLSLLYQQQHQGLMTLGFPSSEHTSQDMASTLNGNNRRGLAGAHHYHRQPLQRHHHQQQQQHGSGNHPQVSFHTLSHRYSVGSFSSSSGRGYDSPTIEQSASYPWNVPSSTNTGTLSHSQSWAGDVSCINLEAIHHMYSV